MYLNLEDFEFAASAIDNAYDLSLNLNSMALLRESPKELIERGKYPFSVTDPERLEKILRARHVVVKFMDLVEEMKKYRDKNKPSAAFATVGVSLLSMKEPAK